MKYITEETDFLAPEESEYIPADDFHFENDEIKLIKIPNSEAVQKFFIGTKWSALTGKHFLNIGKNAYIALPKKEDKKYLIYTTKGESPFVIDDNDNIVLKTVLDKFNIPNRIIFPK